jgi:hypothetical protein
MEGWHCLSHAKIRVCGLNIVGYVQWNNNPREMREYPQGTCDKGLWGKIGVDLLFAFGTMPLACLRYK